MTAGFMIDVGRHFLAKDDVIQILEVMSMYKLNKFHFHVSDDEGFRVQIPDLPELSTVCVTFYTKQSALIRNFSKENLVIMGTSRSHTTSPLVFRLELHSAMT